MDLSNEDKRMLLDWKLSVKLNLWSALLVIDGIIVASITGRLFQNDIAPREIAPNYIKATLILSIISMVLIVCAYFGLMNGLKKLPTEAPKGIIHKGCQVLSLLLTLIALVLLLINGIRWN